MLWSCGYCIWLCCHPAGLRHCLICCCISNPCVDVLYKHFIAILQSCYKLHRGTLGVLNNPLFKITDNVIYQ